MNISTEHPEKTTTKITVELSAEDMKPYLDKAVVRISKEVKVDGFRPGKAPYEMLAKKIGEMEIYQEAAREAVDATLPSAIKKEGLDFVGQPQVSLEKVVPGEGITYSATLAKMPKVTLKKYDSIRVAKPEVKIDEDKVQRTMDDLRKMQAEAKEVEREAKEGDQLVVDFDVKQDGVSIEGGQATQAPVEIGAKQFIPGFEEELVGMKAGDTKTFNLTFPENYGAKHLAGRECEFTVTVHKVNELTLPEINDEFATKLGFPSAEELNTQVRGNIERELSGEADQKFEVELIDAALEQADYEPIPQMMIEAELGQMEQELRANVEDQGGTFEDYLQHLDTSVEDLRESWKEQAEKRVKAALLMKEVAEAEKITVEEDEIKQEVERVKTMYQHIDEDKLAQFDTLDFRAYARTMIRNRKVVEKLTEYATQK